MSQVRKTLISLAIFVLFCGLFAGSWYATNFFVDDPGATVLSEDGDEPPLSDGNTSSTTVVSALEDAVSALSFPKPTTLREFWRSTDSSLKKLGANRIVRVRASAYASLAMYEATRASTSPSVLPAGQGGLSEEEGLVVAGIVLAGIIDNSLLESAIATWTADASSEARSIADVVIKQASTDGFDTISTEAPVTTEGHRGWIPGGTVGGPASGLEPQFGNVATILLPISACPVPTVSPEKVQLGASDLSKLESLTDIDTEALLNLTGLANMVKNYADAVGFEHEKSVHLGVQFNVVLYDALIATWDAKWISMVDSPLGAVTRDDRTLVRSYPSYPSWEAVVIGALETYASIALGQDDSYMEIARIADEQISENTTRTDGNESNSWESTFLRINELLEANVHDWDTDYDAGYDLGACAVRSTIPGQ
jgi:hypothetical protein